jgi:hypothetical protein
MPFNSICCAQAPFDHAMGNSTVQCLSKASVALLRTVSQLGHDGAHLLLFMVNRAINTTQTLNTPQEGAGSNNKASKPPQFSYQYLVSHLVDTFTPKSMSSSGAATPFTRVKSTGYLAPTEASVRASTRSVPYIPSGFATTKLLDAQGRIAVSQLETVIELYTSKVAGPGEDMIQMRATIIAGDAELLRATASRG